MGSKMKLSPEEAANQRYWDEIAPVHYKYYDMESIAAGKSAFDEIQIKDLGDLTGKDLLHLQCHIGNDILPLAEDAFNFYCQIDTFKIGVFHGCIRD